MKMQKKRTSEFEEKSIEIFNLKNKGKILKKMNRDLWDNIKQSHIHIIAVPEVENIENVAELMTEIANLMKRLT